MSTHLPALSARSSSTARSPVRDLLALTEQPGIISFAGGLPAAELFDLDGLREAFAAVLARPGALQYAPSEGHRSLREFIAARYQSQGLPTGPEDILITTGSQQGLTLLAGTLLDPGDVVLTERPSYLAALQAFAFAGARIIGVPTTDNGVDTDALAELVRTHRPKFFYTVPTFQNPTGSTYGLQARADLVELAHRHGMRIVEDEPYRELRYSGEALPYLAASSEEHVISTGSFSKVLAPGMRLGWIRTRSSVRDALVIAKQSADLHTSTVDQAAAAHYLADGRLDAALEVLRSTYRDRRDGMHAALTATLPPGSRWGLPDGGMFFWVRLPPGSDSTALLTQAIDHAVAFVPGPAFYPDHPDAATLRLSFTTYPVETITEGVRRLGRALASADALTRCPAASLPR